MEEIKRLIEQARLEEAIEYLSKKDPSRPLSLLKVEYSQLKDKKLSGLITAEEHRVQLLQIADRILELAEKSIPSVDLTSYGEDDEELQPPQDSEKKDIMPQDASSEEKLNPPLLPISPSKKIQNEQPVKNLVFNKNFLLIVGLALLVFLLYYIPPGPNNEVESPSIQIDKSSAPSLTKVAEDLLPNTVKLEASFSDGISDGIDESGYGFISGMMGDSLYVVTARHVVQKESFDSQLSSLRVLFFHDHSYGQSYIGRVLAADDTYDLALLKVEIPDSLPFVSESLDLTVERGDEVTFIGNASTDWYVPTAGAQGTISKVGTEIIVDINSVRSGTSGGPLISREGVVGLVINTVGFQATALNINYVKEFVLNDGRRTKAFLLTKKESN